MRSSWSSTCSFSILPVILENIDWAMTKRARWGSSLIAPGSSGEMLDARVAGGLRVLFLRRNGTWRMVRGGSGGTNELFSSAGAGSGWGSCWVGCSSSFLTETWWVRSGSKSGEIFSFRIGYFVPCLRGDEDRGSCSWNHNHLTFLTQNHQWYCNPCELGRIRFWYSVYSPILWRGCCRTCFCR